MSFYESCVCCRLLCLGGGGTRARQHTAGSTGCWWCHFVGGRVTQYPGQPPGLTRPQESWGCAGAPTTLPLALPARALPGSLLAPWEGTGAAPGAGAPMAPRWDAPQPVVHVTECLENTDP